MKGIDIKVRKSNFLTMKDLDHDLNVKEKKWDFIFNFLLSQSESIYFKGVRPNYYDHDFDKR